MDYLIIGLICNAAGLCAGLWWNRMELERVRMGNANLLTRLRFVHSKLDWRFQASDFMREGDPGYSVVTDVCVGVTQYMREVQKYAV